MPSKIQIFSWRLCHEILLVFYNLYKRKLDKQPICSICKHNVKTTMHAMRDCSMDVEVRQKTYIQTKWMSIDENHMIDWLL